MTQSLVILVRTTNNMEVNLVSIERINDYILKEKEGVCNRNFKPIFANCSIISIALASRYELVKIVSPFIFPRFNPKILFIFKLLLNLLNAINVYTIKIRKG